MQRQFHRFLELIRQILRLQLPLYGANAAFFLILSLFPGLLLTLSALPWTGLSAQDLITALEGIIPSALMGFVQRLIVGAFYNFTGAVLSVSALAALWSAGRGIQGLMKGLNQAYGVPEERSWIHTRVLSAIYLFVFLVVLLVTLGLHVFGRGLIGILERLETPAAEFISQVIDLRLVLLIVLQILLFALMYTVLPNRKSRFQENLPGAIAAALGWQGFSQLFSVYVGALSEYASIFGSVYAMALGMLWLYFCVVILLFGGALNHLMEENKGKFM